MWRIKNQLGDRTIIPADTTYHHFQNSNLTEGLTGHYNYLTKYRFTASVTHLL